MKLVRPAIIEPGPSQAISRCRAKGSCLPNAALRKDVETGAPSARCSTTATVMIAPARCAVIFLKTQQAVILAALSEHRGSRELLWFPDTPRDLQFRIR